MFVSSPQVLQALACAAGAMLVILATVLAHAYSSRVPAWTIGTGAALAILCIVGMSSPQALAQLAYWLR